MCEHQHESDVPPHGHDVLQRGHDVLEHGLDVLEHGHNVLEHGHDVRQHGHDVCQHGDDVPALHLLDAIASFVLQRVQDASTNFQAPLLAVQAPP